MRHSTTSAQRRPVTKGLRALAVLSGALIVAGGLAACSPPRENGGGSGSTGSAAGEGTLTFGLIGDTKDVLTPWPTQRSISSAIYNAQVFQSLTTRAPDGGVEMELAKSMVPSKGNTVWTIHLRKGVTFQDGSDFGADDVIYSFKHMLDKKNNFPPATQISFIDPDKIKKVDKDTVQITLDKPYGPLPEVLSSERLRMGSSTSKGKPIGTGPFKVDDFTAGQEATFSRYDGYWGKKPGFTKLKMISFESQTALTNALVGGQIDVAASVPFTDVASLKSHNDVKILTSKTSGGPIIEMRMDKPPFDKKKVRQAFKLMINRKKIIEVAYGGFATLANDFNPNNTECTPPNLPQRHQNIGKAKKLLAEAGESDLSLQITTDGGAAGMLKMAQLIAQDGAKAGITIKVHHIDTATFVGKYRQWQFSLGLNGDSYIISAKSHFLPGGEQNQTHMDDPEFEQLANQMYQTSDKDKRCDIIRKMQTIEYTRGGDIIPAVPKSVVAYRSNVHGLEPDVYGRAAYTFDGVTLG